PRPSCFPFTILYSLPCPCFFLGFFLSPATSTTDIYPLSLHDALPILDDMTFQPAAGAHGEFTGVLLIKQYHDARGDSKRRKIIVDRKSTRLNSSHVSTSYAVFCLKKKKVREQTLMMSTIQDTSVLQ